MPACDYRRAARASVAEEAAAEDYRRAERLSFGERIPPKPLRSRPSIRAKPIATPKGYRAATDTAPPRSPEAYRHAKGLSAGELFDDAIGRMTFSALRRA